jgi:hypothetical protein
VAYRPVAKWWLCKQRLFLDSGLVNTFPLVSNRFLIMQQLGTTIAELCFLCGSCRDVISKGQSQLIVTSVRESVRGLERAKPKNLNC